MAEDTESKRVADDPSDVAMKALAEAQAAGPGSAAGMYMSWMEGLSELGSEAAQFIAERIAEDVKTQHEILHCKNPLEIVAIQRRFLQKALDQYLTQGGKLAEMSNEIAKAAVRRKN